LRPNRQGRSAQRLQRPAALGGGKKSQQVSGKSERQRRLERPPHGRSCAAVGLDCARSRPAAVGCYHQCERLSAAANGRSCQRCRCGGGCAARRTATREYEMAGGAHAAVSCGSDRAGTKRTSLCRRIAQQQHQQQRTDHGEAENHETVDISQHIGLVPDRLSQ
jgi:hypothetical protein